MNETFGEFSSQKWARLPYSYFRDKKARVLFWHCNSFEFDFENGGPVLQRKLDTGIISPALFHYLLVILFSFQVAKRYFFGTDPTGQIVTTGNILCKKNLLCFPARNHRLLGGNLHRLFRGDGWPGSPTVGRAHRGRADTQPQARPPCRSVYNVGIRG